MVRRALLRLLTVLVLIVAGVGFAAAPAYAAPKPIGLSTDGVTYADTLGVSLFGGALIVPGNTVIRSFWVQNRDATDGNLAIALQGVTSTDAAYLSALSLSAKAGTASGPTVLFASANPCASLVSGVALASGAAVKVDVTLKLSSSLAAHTSQGSVGGFDVKVTLTSTDVPAPGGCPVVTPPNPGGGGSGGGGTGGHGGSTTTPVGQIDTTVVSGAADGIVAQSGDSYAVSAGTGRGIGAEIVFPNTGRFFQEFDVVGWLLAMALGGIFAWWRRRRREYVDPNEIEWGPARVPAFMPAYPTLYKEADA